MTTTPHSTPHEKTLKRIVNVRLFSIQSSHLTNQETALVIVGHGLGMNYPDMVETCFGGCLLCIAARGAGAVVGCARCERPAKASMTEIK